MAATKKRTPTRKPKLTPPAPTLNGETSSRSGFTPANPTAACSAATPVRKAEHFWPSAKRLIGSAGPRARSA